MPLPQHDTRSMRQIGPGDGDYVVSYHWLHFETGKTGVTEQKFVSRSHFLELLDLWNQDGRWKYWSKPR
jgi:hypothetical protein